MSRRGGGRGSVPRQDQPAPAVARGGDGAARGRGRGRGRGAPAQGSRPAPAPAPVARASPTPEPAARSEAAAPPQARAAPVSSTAQTSASPVEALAKDVSERLLVQGTAASSSSARSLRPPARPGYGRVGTKCLVKANHFLVKVADTDLCHYDVTITPEVISKKLNRKVVEKMVTLFSESNMGGKKPAYDGMKSLYTAGELPFQSKDFVIKLDNDEPSGSSSRSKRRDREFKVVVKFASKPDLHHLRQFLQGRQHDMPQETIQVLDVVLRQAPAMKYTVVGRSFFDPTLGGKGSLGNGTEFWKGYYQSLRPTQMGLALNIDVSATGFYETIPVVEFLERYHGFKGKRTWTELDRLKAKKALRGIRVESNHLAHKKTYKISGVSMEPVSKLMFSLDGSAKQISVAQYFWEKYQIQLKYANWPALQAGSSTKPASIPIEICTIVKGQRYTKRLNEMQVRNMLKATCQRPHEREKSITTMANASRKDDGDVVQQFGIQVHNAMATVEARVLPPPLILYEPTGRNPTETPRMGQWNMINKKMENGGRVDYWSCVSFSDWDDHGPHDFCRDLIQMCTSRGMTFGREPFVPIRSSHPNKIERTLVDIHTETEKKGHPLQLLIVILPNITGSYDKIKRVCETELGIVTQCCKPTARINQQYFENLSLKINVKVGGRNSVLNDAVKRNIPLVTDVPTIIFGADVTHPSPGEDTCPSIAAVVASMDWPQISKYRGLVSAQAHRREIIDDLYSSVVDPSKGIIHKGMVKELLLAFFKSTNQKPKRIIFYRDGVSEGQFKDVLLHEMDAIRKACTSLESDYLPPVTFIVVQKRHHTRLFPVERGLTDKSGNILPGTVVDTQICHPTEFDFYLNSHAGIQGTSRPAHYHVLYDENRFTADALQSLTNILCYTYVRCTRSVSIVPPAYYAHLAAFRARCYLDMDASDAGSSSGGSGGAPRPFRGLPEIKANVKDVMFYC